MQARVLRGLRVYVESSFEKVTKNNVVLSSHEFEMSM